MSEIVLNEIGEDRDLENRFTYHSPKEGQSEVYERIRFRLKENAYMINQLVPNGREKSLALTKLEEAMFWANAGVARHG